MALTYEPIATTTLGSAQSTVTFSGIASAYTDLVLIVNAGSTSGTGYGLRLQVNGDTGTNYSWTYLYGTGTAAGSARGSSVASIFAGYTASAVGDSVAIINLMNYANTTTNKTIITRASESDYRVGAHVGLWRSTSAITSITFFDEGGGNFKAGSQFTLFGIKAA